MPKLALHSCLASVLALCFSASAQPDALAPVREAMARGQWAGALQSVEAVSRAQPQNAQARFLHAVVLMEMGRDDQALPRFMQLNQEYPELPEPLNNIARLHARSGQLELARQALESALRNDPGHVAARGNLAQVHLMLAVQHWERAAAAAPADAALQARLSNARAFLAALPR